MCPEVYILEKYTNQGFKGGDQYPDHGAMFKTHNCIHLESEEQNGNCTYNSSFEPTTNTPIGEGERVTRAEPMSLINDELHHLEH